MKEEIVSQLLNGDQKQIEELTEKVHPVDTANAIEELDDDKLIKIFAFLPDDYLSEMLEFVDEDFQIKMVDLLSFERVSRLFQMIPRDTIVDILGNLPVGTRKSFLRMMKASDQEDINHLLSYDTSSAGG